jgi:hypothetical protein
MMTYADAEKMLRNRDSKKIRYETRLYRVPGTVHDSFAIVHHSTGIVEILHDGSYVLKTGGWHSVTTKKRLNDYSPARVFSDRGALYVSHPDAPKGRVPFTEGMRIDAAGLPEIPEPPRDTAISSADESRALKRILRAWDRHRVSDYRRGMGGLVVARTPEGTADRILISDAYAVRAYRPDDPTLPSCLHETERGNGYEIVPERVTGEQLASLVPGQARGALLLRTWENETGGMSLTKVGQKIPLGQAEISETGEIVRLTTADGIDVNRALLLQAMRQDETLYASAEGLRSTHGTPRPLVIGTRGGCSLSGKNDAEIVGIVMPRQRPEPCAFRPVASSAEIFA